MDVREFTTGRILVPLLFLALGLIESIHRLVQIRVGYIDLFVDARAVWKPAAHAVLTGTPLYIGHATDNKPPLWQFLNVLVGLTGHYTAVFTLLVGIANATAAILIWRYLRLAGYEKIGILSGVLLLSMIPVVQGRVINVRSFAVIGILVALQVRHPFLKGLAVGSAALMSQYGILAGIPILWTLLNRREGRWRDASLFILGGAVLCLVSYLLVYFMWPDSFVAAVRNSILISGHYATQSAKYTLWETPLVWGGGILRVVLGSLYVFLPAALTARYEVSGRTADPIPLLSIVAVTLLLPLLVRSFQVYWIYPLPFLAALGAFGYDLFFSEGIPGVLSD
ncbi:hypothetical protein [Halarchaeum acidiphilum]|uniref:hypothetical protein n=1 Tax=Halarchaeum acidiphilum TaxID=489138 RepID=UPI00037D686C|nr:hypothetical protein [Halarchaeum acidiphilum]